MAELVEKKTIGEVERIVHGSGMWDGTGPVEFSNDGDTWVTAWAPTDDHPHPVYARVSTYRKDVRIPTAVTIRWDEQFPEASDEWAAAWTHAPMRHFERTARMIAFRRTFRDLLGDIVIEDEGDERAEPGTPRDVPTPERDWAAEIAAADTGEQLNAIEKDARAARIFTPDAAGTALHRALRARRNELVDIAAGAVWSAMVANEQMSDEVGSVKEPAHEVRQPQDHRPPANRAARRAAARKKGGKR